MVDVNKIRIILDGKVVEDVISFQLQGNAFLNNLMLFFYVGNENMIHSMIVPVEEMTMVNGIIELRCELKTKETMEPVYP
jgi:hypothetical protein